MTLWVLHSMPFTWNWLHKQDFSDMSNVHTNPTTFSISHISDLHYVRDVTWVSFHELRYMGIITKVRLNRCHFKKLPNMGSTIKHSAKATIAECDLGVHLENKPTFQIWIKLQTHILCMHIQNCWNWCHEFQPLSVFIKQLQQPLPTVSYITCFRHAR